MVSRHKIHLNSFRTMLERGTAVMACMLLNQRATELCFCQFSDVTKSSSGICMNCLRSQKSLSVSITCGKQMKVPKCWPIECHAEQDHNFFLIWPVVREAFDTLVGHPPGTWSAYVVAVTSACKCMCSRNAIYMPSATVPCTTEFGCFAALCCIGWSTLHLTTMTLPTSPSVKPSEFSRSCIRSGRRRKQKQKVGNRFDMVAL